MGSQETPKRPQEAPRDASRSPRGRQARRKRGPREPQDSPKSAQARPKSAPRGTLPPRAAHLPDRGTLWASSLDRR
eukprot:7312881-Pyramimonas_sp.AAC.1